MAQRTHIKAVVGGLRKVRARLRATLTAQRATLVFAGVVGALLTLGLLDYALRLPGWIRWANWIAGVAALIFALTRYVWPALRLNPSLTDLALRIERTRPELRGLLASAVDFARRDDHRITDMERALRDRVLETASGSWTAGAARGLTDMRRTWRSVGLASLALIAALALFALTPPLASIGLARSGAPWLGAEWPKRTLVADATDLTVHPLGAAAPLRAALARSTRDAEEARVTVHYRAIDAQGAPGPTRSALMTHQRRSVPVRIQDRSASREVEAPLFERLIEVDAEALEYRFRTLDDETPWRRIKLVPPPRVESARATITPPDYAAGMALGEDGALGTRIDVALGAGADERAVAPASLVGSTIDLTLTLNKPVPPPESGEARNDWIARTLGGDALDAGAQVEITAQSIAVRWTVRDSVRIPVVLVDSFGIESVEEAVFRFEAVEDRAPSATVTAPPTDEAVIPTAVVEIEGEGRDDVGLARVWIDRRIATPIGQGERSGPGGAVEPQGDPVVVAEVAPDGRRAARITATLELATTGVEPGDEVWINALAADALATSTGLRDPTRSATRRLLIIDESELIERIQNDLAAVRQSAIRIDEQQAQTAERFTADGPSETARRSQSQVSERIDRQREAIERLTERVERNALDDSRLDLLLQEAQRRLTEAGRASSQADQTMDGAAQRAEQQNQDPQDALTEEEQRETDRAQERVRDELADLVELLDAGQDTWVTRRRIEQLLEQQRQNLEATREQQRQTAGLSPDELSEQQQESLRDIVRQQEELASESQRLADELPEKADELKESDPAAAAGLEQAARSARESKLSERMEQAAQEAQENRVADSARSQEQAAEALEQLLEELEQGEQARRDELRRLLADLTQSIESLIRAQETELAALDDALTKNLDAANLDQGMIRLHRNTLSVADQARAGGPEAGGVVRALERAAEQQINAIGELRNEVIDLNIARPFEEQSLARLQEALEEARRAQEQQELLEQLRQKAELRAAYREALERQQTVRDATAPFEGQNDITRRDRATLRGVGEEQSAIGELLTQLRRATEELAEAAIFDYAHNRLDESIVQSTESLRAGEPDVAVPPQDRALALLRGILKALDDSQRQQEEQFAQGGAGGQSGQQGQQQQPPLIPPAAELRLLREIQADLALRTRAQARATPQRVEALGSEQQDLATLGQELLRRLQQQSGGFSQPEQQDDVPIQPIPPQPEQEQPQ